MATHTSRHLRCSFIVIVDAMKDHQGYMSALSGQMFLVYQTHAKDASVKGEGPRRFVILLARAMSAVTCDGEWTRFVAN